MTMAAIQKMLGVMMAILSLTSGFRIRRSGVAGYDDPYGLTNAFGDMNRNRRGDFRALLRKGVIGDDSPYFDPNTIPLSYIDKLPYLEEDNDESYGFIPEEFTYDKSYKNYGPVDEYPFQSPVLDDRMFGPQKRTPHSSNRVVPTMEELRTIFGEADVPMKRLAPVKRQEPKQIVQVADKESRAEAVRKLLNAAEQLSENENDSEAGETVVESSEDNGGNELLDIFSDANKGDNVETDREAKIGTDDNGDIFAEKNELTEENPAQSKSKRASNGVTSDYVLTLLKQIAELKKKVSKLEIVQVLEGKENDYLANALKFATLDQIQDEDAFVAKEYSDITKATEAEAIIQRLTEGR